MYADLEQAQQAEVQQLRNAESFLVRVEPRSLVELARLPCSDLTCVSIWWLPVSAGLWFRQCRPTVERGAREAACCQAAHARCCRSHQWHHAVVTCAVVQIDCQQTSATTSQCRRDGTSVL